MVRIRVRSLSQSGFTFGKNNPFSEELAHRFYSAVLGPDDGAGLDELRERVEKKLKEIFRICLQYRELYTALRGSGVFWELAAEQWDTLDYVSGDDVAAFVEAYRTARERSSQNGAINELSRLVDESIEMHKDMLAIPPAPKFQIALRPSAISQTTQDLTNLSISNSTTATTWPPSHYTEQEVVWFSHDHVLSQVHGLTCRKKPHKAQDLPKIPDAFTHPLDIRLFLAFTALTNFRANRKISLCMTPITFWDDDERKDWYLATGGASKFCWTTWDFCNWAKAEFGRGRDAVVGLCHYVSSKSDFYLYLNADFSKTAPRYSVGILIRRIEKDVYEFIMEDAHYHRVSANPEYYEEKYNVYPNSGMDFKSALLQDVESHFGETSFWHGGDVPNAFKDIGVDNLTDTVSVSCSFVFLAVQGKVPKKDLGQEGWGFSRNVPEKMRYWENDKEGGEKK
ncbi:hypothetical protein FHL15_003084 [Xylaria flabelliformis]|uniref:Uncharacterized protein n=1 Tax=Xylaria flabelliformis TaxID=2512241 RepID=A0A553I6W1_9PEZI|nr:hypothetical protein FHL15_003084 [Xylaria flabelliformis]